MQILCNVYFNDVLKNASQILMMLSAIDSEQEMLQNGGSISTENNKRYALRIT